MNWSQHQNEMWEAAEFLDEWDHEGIRYKALEVPRDSIDEDSGELLPALWVIGLNDGAVRVYDEFFDPCFDRMSGQEEALAKLLSHAPEEVISFVDGNGLEVPRDEHKTPPQ